jgi:tetratricopeptide (TPR) repeat protein
MTGGRTAPRLAMVVVAGLVCGILLTGTGRAQGPDDITGLRAEVSRLHGQGKYAEALPFAQRAPELAQKRHGEEHPEYASAIAWLAAVYFAQGRYAEAEPLYRRSLDIIEKVLGANHPELGRALNNLAELYRTQGRYAEAEPLYKRSLATRETALGPEHLEVGTALGNLALLYETQGRYAEAEPLQKRSLDILEKALGPEHPTVATSLNNLALLREKQGRYPEAEAVYRRSQRIYEKALGPEHPYLGQSLDNLARLYNSQGRYSDAEQLFGRSLAIREKALGAEHSDVGSSLENLAALYQTQGRYTEAERLYKRALAIFEKALGPNHRDVGAPLNGLGGLYGRLGRHAEAELLYRRSLTIAENTLGPEHPDVAVSLHNLAELYRVLGRFAEAEPLYRRDLAITEKALGPGHHSVGQTLNSLGVLYRALGRYTEAEQLCKRSIVIYENALGSEHPKVASSLNSLALLYESQGRYGEAEALYKRSIVIYEKALGSEHPLVGDAFSNLAGLAYVQSDWASAAEYWQHSTSIIKRRAVPRISGGRGETSGLEAPRLALRFSALVKTTHRLIVNGRDRTTALSTEMFETAQWTLGSEVATSLAQMAARSAKGSPQLAVLVRKQQDLESEWQVKDKLLIAAKSEAPAKRKPDMEKVLADRLAAIDTRLADLGQELARDFPDYAALASPAAVSVGEVQEQLAADEALLLFLATPKLKPIPEETFVWVVTKSSLRLVRSDLGTVALAREVTALRCGLDATAWYGDGAEKCAGALGIPLNKAAGANQQLPFDHSRAHKLYSVLFGEVQDLIKGKHLLIVPSGPLTQLPFQVLVTKAPASSNHRAVAWLAREHAITILPAVSSLKALRRVGKPSAASKPMIGFGNPLLDGPDARYAGRAKLAREKQLCPVGSLRVAALAGLRGDVQRVETRSGLADVSHIKLQVPLPETATSCALWPRM